MVMIHRESTFIFFFPRWPCTHIFLFVMCIL